MEVFVDVWEAQVEELGKVLRLITAGGDPSKSKWNAENTDGVDERILLELHPYVTTKITKRGPGGCEGGG